LGQAKKKLALGGGGGGADVEDIGGVKFIGRVLDGVSGKDLRGMLNDQRGEKVAVAVAVTPDLTDKFSAAELVNKGAEKVGGRGGGKAEMAQAGGNNVAGADDALAAIKSALTA